MEILIRQAALKDATEITALAHQLGYSLPTKQISTNISTLLAKDDQNLFVAEHNGKVIGWIGVAYIIILVSKPYCEINGLVIDSNYRGKGIGNLLIEKAKQWGREKNCNKVKLKCNVIRTETHLFYQHLGFRDVKKQTNFEIDI